jgi:hypothetical protein
LAELHPIKEVKSFGAKLQIDLLGNGRSFEEYGVIIGYPLRAQRGIGAGLIAESVIGWLGKATGIEPPVLPGDRISGHCFIATRSHAGPWSAGAKLLADEGRLCCEYQWEAEGVGGDSVERPQTRTFVVL